MRALARCARVGAGMLALAAGLVLGSGGCGWRCRCPEIEALVGGVFEIVASPDRPALIGGTVEAVDDTVTVEYVDEDGVEWTVVYDVKSKFPE